jgi:hypothetical protein
MLVATNLYGHNQMSNTKKGGNATTLSVCTYNFKSKPDGCNQAVLHPCHCLDVTRSLGCIHHFTFLRDMDATNMGGVMNRLFILLPEPEQPEQPDH